MAATILNLTSGVVYLRGGNAFSGVLTSTAGILNIGDGTAAAPAFAFASQPGLGWYKSGTNVMSLADSGLSNSNPTMTFSNNGISLPASTWLGWTASTNSATGNPDTTISRPSALGALKLLLSNNAVSAGAVLDFSTDGTLKVRGAAGTAATGNLDIGAKLTAYSNQTTAGWGLPAILGETITGTLSGASQTVLSVTPAAVAARYKIDAAVTSTSGTNTGTVQITVDYVDSQGTVHTGDIIFLAGANAAGAATQTGASKEWHTVPWTITVNNAGTAIVLKLVTTGTVAATVAASVERVG